MLIPRLHTNLSGSVLIVLLILLMSSVGFAGITNFNNKSGDHSYTKGGNWDSGIPNDGKNARIRYGNHAIVDVSTNSSNTASRYYLTVGFQDEGTLTVEAGKTLKAGYNRKVWIGGDNNGDNTRKCKGTLHLYGELKLIASAKGLVGPGSYDNSAFIIGYRPDTENVTYKNYGYVTVYDGGELDASGPISVVKGELRYEALAKSSSLKPRNQFLVGTDGRLTFETDDSDVATVVFGPGSIAKLNLFDNIPKVKMELSGAFSIGQKWRLFDNVNAWKSANNGTTVLSDQGYTFYWDRTVGAYDGYVDVSLTKANVVQLPRTLPVGDGDPNTSRDVPIDGNIVWGIGSIDPNHPTNLGFDVYFGLDPNSDHNPKVLSATNATSYDPPGDLLYSATYYTRVDTIDQNDLDLTHLTFKGGTWKFTTPRRDPILTKSPGNRSVNTASSSIFTAAGDDTDSYQWYKDGDLLVDITGKIEGANTAALTVHEAVNADEGSYTCRLSKDGSLGVVFSVNGKLTVRPIITINLKSPSADFEETAVFAFATTAGASYQWFKVVGEADTISEEWDDIALATDDTYIVDANSLSLINVVGAHKAEYYCIATILEDSEATTPRSLNTNPILLGGPTDILVFEGETAQFTVDSPLADSFVWYKDGELIVEGGDISDVNSATLSIANVEAADEGAYYCVVSSWIYDVEDPPSAPASLVIKRLQGHWKFDTDVIGTFSNGDPGRIVITDEVGGFDGYRFNPNGPLHNNPVFYSDTENVDGYSYHSYVGTAHIEAGGTKSQYDFIKTAFTVSTWVRKHPAMKTETYAAVVSKENEGEGFFLRAFGNGSGAQFLMFGESANGNTQHNVAVWNRTVDVMDGQWHLLTATFDTITNEMNLYVDGTIGDTGVLQTHTVKNPNANLAFGCRARESKNNYHGLMDEVKIYNYVLDHDDIAQEYADENPEGNFACKKITASDRDGDCMVNLVDYAVLAAEDTQTYDRQALLLAAIEVMASEWLDGNFTSENPPASDRSGDYFVNLVDYALLAVEPSIDPVVLDKLVVMAGEWLDDINIVAPAP